MKAPAAPRLGELVEMAARRLDAAGLSYGHGTSNALEEAAWIVLHAAGLPVDALDRHLDDRLDSKRAAAAQALIEERVRTRKPAAYLLKEAWLGPHRFYVDERVIVPRSFIAEIWGRSDNSELLLRPQTILDLCTGSGCLAILAALRHPEARVDAADISADALEVARINVAAYGLEGRVRRVQSDLFSALQGERYDLIVSNPPYVKAAAMRRLPDEYREEPELALASGADGLDHTRRILADAARHLHPEGTLVMEIGHNRKALEKAFPRLPFRWPRTSAGRGYVFTLKREDLD